MRLARILLGVFVGLTACAQRVPPPAVTPGDLAALEARRSKAQNNPDELTAIGIAFSQAGAYERARDVFLAVLVLQPQAFPAAIELGLAYEGLGRYEEALEAYHRAGALKLSKLERKTVADRLAALGRVRLAVEARRVIAEESTLARTAPVANSIAVLPWTYLGANEELRPLERGLAHLVLTDLAKVSHFTLLEREKVQALTDELRLDAAGRVDPATAARSGRLLRAAEVVQGSIRESGSGAVIRLDANIVDASNAAIQATGSAADRLDALLAMEKAVVLMLLDKRGVVLTPAESRAIAERPTADLQAFLAFSRGLEAEDQGRFNEAAQYYLRAAERDPSFSLARQRASSTARTSRVSRMTPVRLAQLIGGPAQRDGPSGRQRIALTPSGLRAAQLAGLVQGIAPTLAGHLTQAAARSTAIRARLAEALRQDDPGRIGKLLETLPRP